MPLTPVIAEGSQAGSPFNFAALRPSGGAFSTLGLTAFGIVPVSDSIIFMFQSNISTLVEYSMVDGDPATMVATGNTLLLPGLPNQMCYDRDRGRIYYRDLFTSRVNQIDLIGETLAGSSMSPLFFIPPVGGGWTIGLSGDGLSIYLSTFATEIITRLDFGTPGDVSTLNFVENNDYPVGAIVGFVSLLVSGDSSTITVVPNGIEGPITTLWLRAPRSLAAPSTTTALSTGRQISLHPFKSGGEVTLLNTNPDGTRLFMSSTGQSTISMFTLT